MANESPTITCSASEATFLASLLGAQALLGMPDPFLGWLADEIEAAWADAKQTLAARRYLALEADGQIVVDTTVAALIGVWAQPAASFILTYTPANASTRTHYFHLTRDRAVEQIADDAGYHLTALENAAAVYARTLELLRVREQTAAGATNVVLLQAQLTQARERAAQTGVAGALAALAAAGAAPAALAPLAQTLATPVANGAFVALAQGATAWQVAGLGLLEGANGLWRLRACKRDAADWTEAIPCDATQARAEIRQVMNRVLPEPLPAESKLNAE